MVCPHGQVTRVAASSDIFQTRRRVNFLWFCADVFYGRSLTMNRNIDMICTGLSVVVWLQLQWLDLYESSEVSKITKEEVKLKRLKLIWNTGTVKDFANSGVVREESGGIQFWAQALRAHKRTLQSFKNMF